MNLENIFHHQEYFFRESSLFFKDLLGVAGFLSGVRTIPWAVWPSPLSPGRFPCTPVLSPTGSTARDPDPRVAEVSVAPTPLYPTSITVRNHEDCLSGFWGVFFGGGVFLGFGVFHSSIFIVWFFFYRILNFVHISFATFYKTSVIFRVFFLFLTRIIYITFLWGLCDHISP